jgi:hypothetical protein
MKHVNDYKLILNFIDILVILYLEFRQTSQIQLIHCFVTMSIVVTIIIVNNHLSRQKESISPKFYDQFFVLKNLIVVQWYKSTNSATILID